MDHGQYIERRPSLPNDTAVLVLGIISIVICGVGLIPGIIALSLAAGPRRQYRDAPHLYSQSSYNNLNAGRTCAIIGICLSGVLIIFYIFYILFIVSIVGTAIGSSAAAGSWH